MTSFLVVYATSEGQTAKIAAQLQETIANRGHDVTALDVNDLSDDLSLTDYEAVVVGSSIHMGKQATAIQSFVADNRAFLNDRPSAFFQVSLSSAVDDPTRRAEAARYVEDFLEATGWQPANIGLFGGALRYTKYGFLKRLLLKRIAKEATGDIDTAQDYEYTDWNEVEAFAADFASFVEARLGTGHDPAEP